MRGSISAVVTVTALAILAITAAADASRGETRLRPARTQLVPHEYIVVLKGGLPVDPTKRSERTATAEDERVARSVGARPQFVYNADLRGFAARLTRSELRRLRHDRLVKYVEQDERVKELADHTQTDAPWDLDRIDQQFLPLDSAYHYASEGAGVTVYVLDTGILTTSSDFGSRATFGVNMVDRNDADCNGHGTHVAGIVGGTKYGVAKLVRLVAVKVLNCGGSGTMAGVIAGANWVAEHHVADRSVANMSLGGGSTPALNAAVSELVASGVFVSVAAGNNNQNACSFSPAGTPAAFTVAASDSSDKKASFSNFGPCVDAYAPGVAVPSDWIGSPTASNTISGTSMAAPIVAGIAALYLSDHPATPAATGAWIVDHATGAVISNSPGDTPNRLVDKSGL